VRQSAEKFKTCSERRLERYVVVVFEDPQRRRVILLVVIAIIGILIGLLVVDRRKNT
jgi:hypothetical protein